MKSYDVIVIGAGPGGYVAAIEAAKHGQKVAVIEKNAIGGTCLNVGCIPSKSYLTHASWLNQLTEAQAFGIKSQLVSIDFPRLVGRKDQVVNQLQQGIHYLFKQHRIDYFEGEAKVNQSQEVTVGTEVLSGVKLILATGSRPFVPPIKGLEEVSYLTTDDFFEMRTLPKELVIIGGGVIAIELAFAMAPLGVKVTVIEVAEDILLTEDPDARTIIKQQLQHQGIGFQTSAKIREVKEGVVVLGDGQVAFEQLLVATGRVSNLALADELGLKKSETGKRLIVNQYYQTSQSNIYAIGDLVDSYMLAHVASQEGVKAVRHLLGKGEEKVKPTLVPRCVYTTPEIASFGLSEEEAKARGYQPIVTMLPFSASGKAISANETVGFVKLIADRNYGEILGAVIVGSHATELIQTVLAVKASEGRVDELASMIFAHPTLSESIGEAAINLLDLGK